LLSTGKRCAKAPPLDGDLRRLAAFEDYLRDVRCEERVAQDPTDVALVHPKLLSDHRK
jgi:hypothetical protein